MSIASIQTDIYLYVKSENSSKKRVYLGETISKLAYSINGELNIVKNKKLIGIGNINGRDKIMLQANPDDDIIEVFVDNITDYIE